MIRYESKWSEYFHHALILQKQSVKYSFSITLLCVAIACPLMDSVWLLFRDYYLVITLLLTALFAEFPVVGSLT